MFNDIDTYMIVFHISATCIQVEILTKQFKLIFFCYQSIFIIDIFFVKVLLLFSYYFLLFAIINYQKLDKVVYKSVTIHFKTICRTFFFIKNKENLFCVLCYSKYCFSVVRLKNFKDFLKVLTHLKSDLRIEFLAVENETEDIN